MTLMFWWGCIFIETFCVWNTKACFRHNLCAYEQDQTPTVLKERSESGAGRGGVEEGWIAALQWHHFCWVWRHIWSAILEWKSQFLIVNRPFKIWKENFHEIVETYCSHNFTSIKTQAHLINTTVTGGDLNTDRSYITRLRCPACQSQIPTDGQCSHLIGLFTQV